MSFHVEVSPFYHYDFPIEQVKKQIHNHLNNLYVLSNNNICAYFKQ